MTDAAAILRAASETFLARHAVYGDNYKMVGDMMKACFPDGIRLETAEDHNRFHIFMLIIVKLSRYAVNWDNGGHADSLRDGAIYCSFLEAIDAEIADASDAMKELDDMLKYAGTTLEEKT